MTEDLHDRSSVVHEDLAHPATGIHRLNPRMQLRFIWSISLHGTSSHCQSARLNCRAIFKNILPVYAAFVQPA